MSLTDNLAIVDVWAGSAELRMPEVQGEEMHLIAPLRVGRGYRLGMAYSVTDLRILKNMPSSSLTKAAVEPWRPCSAPRWIHPKGSQYEQDSR